LNRWFPQRLLALVRLGRPHFLLGGFVLYGLGAALAALAGAAIDGRRYAWGQVAITAIQLMTHYCNDYFDFAADHANTTSTRFSGGSRVLPGGILSPTVALGAALMLAVVAVLATVVVARLPGAGGATAPLLVMMLVLAWEYSAPPLRLHSRGLGELTTALVVTLLTPVAGFYLQAGRFIALPVLTVLPLCAFQFAMLLAIEFPDAAGDASVGKRTLVVRLGGARAARLYNGVLAAAYLSLPALVWAGMPGPIALAVAVTAPVVAWQARRMARGAWGEPTRWESLALVAVALVGVSSGLMLAAALWMLGRGGY
jgi:1,4-dihydroxy-2-naphthoate octaprenyltransferase